MYRFSGYNTAKTYARSYYKHKTGLQYVSRLIKSCSSLDIQLSDIVYYNRQPLYIYICRLFRYKSAKMLSYRHSEEVLPCCFFIKNGCRFFFPPNRIEIINYKETLQTYCVGYILRTHPKGVMGLTKQHLKAIVYRSS